LELHDKSLSLQQEKEVVMKAFIIKVLSLTLKILLAPSLLIMVLFARVVYGKNWRDVPPVSNDDDSGWIE